MAEIIQFANGEELSSLLAEANQQVSGMTPQEAYNALKLVESEKIVTGNVTKSGSNIIQFTSGSASEAVDSFVANGGNVSSTGAATTGPSTTANISIVKNATGTAGVVGLLTANVPTVMAAVAPLLGVSVGAGLYELSPDFWTKVSKAVLPFAWKDTEAVPLVVDENGRVYVEGRIIQSMQEIFAQEGIGTSSSTTSSLDVSPFPTPLRSFKSVTIRTVVQDFNFGKGYTLNTLIANNDGRIVIGKTGENSVYSFTSFTTPDGTLTRDYKVISSETGEIKQHDVYTTEQHRNYSHNGLKVYYAPYSWTVINTIESMSGISSPNYIPSSINNDGNIAWTAIYGEEAPVVSGINDWTGDKVENPYSGVIDVVVDKSGSTEPYYPIQLPVGDVPPGTSNDPEVAPNPVAPTPFPEITPYIPPVVNPNKYPVEIPYPDESDRTAPIPGPVPNTNPKLDPEADPSKQPEPVPDPEPAQETNPSSGGSSPPAIFPPIGAFPSIIPSSGSGLIHVYNPTPEEMIAFGHWLWVTYADASIQKLWNNPFDGVISAHELYATPSVDGRDNIRSGFLVCPTSANLVRVRYNQINCGSIVIPEWYANYLDYSPYTKASVYLPFIGIVELDSDDIVGHGINITYTIDSYNGSCIAQITVAKQGYNNTVYQFSGNCSVELPLAGGSQAAIKAGMISAAATGITSVIGGVASLLNGNIPGAIGGVAHGIGSAVSTAVSQKSTVQHSGSFGASYGAMGIKKPYLIIRRPIQKQVTNYNEEYGFPAHKRVLIGSCSGYLRAREVHVVSPTATDEEKAMIERLLKQGVFVS